MCLLASITILIIHRNTCTCVQESEERDEEESTSGTSQWLPTWFAKNRRHLSECSAAVIYNATWIASWNGLHVYVQQITVILTLEIILFDLKCPYMFILRVYTLPICLLQNSFCVLQCLPLPSCRAALRFSSADVSLSHATKLLYYTSDFNNLKD